MQTIKHGILHNSLNRKQPRYPSGFIRYILVIHFIILLLILDWAPGFSQPKSQPLQLLAKGFLFQPLVSDPIQCQSGASLLRLYSPVNQSAKFFIPVSLGFQQSLIRYSNNNGPVVEAGLGAASFTQFIISGNFPENYHGRILNSDFKASGFLNVLVVPFAVRLQVFHESSHLADQYILMNNITTTNNGTRNYEQLDVTVAYTKLNWIFYAGPGYVISKNTFRKRFSAEAGFQHERPLGKSEILRFIAGSDIKFFQQNDYLPDIRLIAGVGLGRLSNVHWNFFLEYFSGHLPYSTIDYGKITWFGAGTVIVPARMK